MKKIICYSLLLIFLSSAQAQNIIAMEYFVDVDSGFGNGIPMTGFPNQPDVANFPFTIPASLSQGIHTIGIRSMDANNKWSLTNFFSFEILDTSNALITQLEYFWDIDPGLNAATDTVLSVPVADLSNGVLYAHVPSSISLGQHTLFVRSKESRNRWSHTNYAQVTITPVGTAELSELPEINIYPNPVIDELTVTPKNGKAVRFILYDAEGQLMFDKTIEGQTEIDMTSYSAGAYTIFLWTDKNKVYRSTAIKQ